VDGVTFVAVVVAIACASIATYAAMLAHRDRTAAEVHKVNATLALQQAQHHARSAAEMAGAARAAWSGAGEMAAVARAWVESSGVPVEPPEPVEPEPEFTDERERLLHGPTTPTTGMVEPDSIISGLNRISGWTPEEIGVKP